MAIQIRHWDEELDGSLSQSSMTRMLQDKGYQVTQYVYPPGTVFTAHTHDVDKIDGVLSGRFKMSMSGHSVILEAGDTLEVPKGAIHSAEVIGNDPVISLDAIRY